MDAVKNITLKKTESLSDDPVHEYFLRDIFDKTGAIRIKKEEFQVLNSQLKKYFLAKWKGVNIRMVEDSSNYYLRGNMFYIACMEIDVDLSIVKIIEEIEAIERTLKKFFYVKKSKLNHMEHVLLLGLLDNRKSHVIEILSMVHQVQRYTSGINLTSTEYRLLLKYTQSTIDDFYVLLIQKEFSIKKMQPI